ncbi:MAG: hypothetical protein AB1768_21235, partial [Pseudomonadota bacterium]
LDQPTAERFARTVNKLKGAATILFIAHQVPRGLEADQRIVLRPEQASAPTPMGEHEASG